MTDPIWQPSAERIAQANLTRFAQYVNDDAGLYPHAHGLHDMPALYTWSIEHPEEFWAAMWSFSGIVANSAGWEQVCVGLDRMAPPDKDLGPRWFTGTRLNFAENLLRHCRDEDARQRDALVFWNEQGRQRALSFAELQAQVAQVAAALRAMGIGAGDRVAGYLPNLPETVIAMLAAASLGAIWSSCSPDFGTAGVLDRFGQIQPRILFCAAGYIYNGKQIDCLPVVSDIVDKIPEIERVVVVPYTGDASDLGSIRNATAWDEFVAPHAGATSIEFVQLPFDHPLYIMYSSGTTGLPKCMVHSAGGTLIQHLKELMLHSDLKPADRIFYYTTCGWMMWNWLVSSLAVGAAVVLYDGSPVAPRPGILWEMAEAEQLTHFGTSAKYLSLIEKEGVRPGTQHNLACLRAILSTGSPLSPESFDYVYREIRADLQLASISGGTDIISCFALGDPTGPVRRGELQTRGLGMAVEILDDNGRPIVGRAGELCCSKPFPSMPASFWNDTDGAKYRAAYFEHYEGVWRHGDWAELTTGGGLIIYGRSDATLNPGGVRIGTAEIYRQVDALDEVLESIVIGQRWKDDVRIVLFVRMREGHALDDELMDRIRKLIRQNCSPHHVPKKIIAVPDIPRTISGKITELAVANVVHGRPVKNVDALANPEALENFRNLNELAD